MIDGFEVSLYTPTIWPRWLIPWAWALGAGHVDRGEPSPVQQEEVARTEIYERLIVIRDRALARVGPPIAATAKPQTVPSCYGAGPSEASASPSDRAS